MGARTPALPGRHSELSDTVSHQYSSVLSQVVASDVMTPLVISLQEDQPIRDAAGLFFGLRISSAPVLDAGSQLVGLLEETHLLNAVSSDSAWATPVKEVMKSNVVCYERGSGRRYLGLSATRDDPTRGDRQ